MNAKTIYDIKKYNFDGKDYKKVEGNVEKLSELKKQTNRTTSEDNEQLVNPGHGAGRVNNCLYCTAAFELRERGYDVQARKKNAGEATAIYSDWFKDIKYQTAKFNKEKGESRKSFVMRSYENLCQKLESFGEGSRGYLGMTWENANSGHVVNWIIEDGNAIFYDGQNPISYESDKYGDMFSFTTQEYTYARLDNLKLKEGVTSAVISRGGSK